MEPVAGSVLTYVKRELARFTSWPLSAAGSRAGTSMSWLPRLSCPTVQWIPGLVGLTVRPPTVAAPGSPRARGRIARADWTDLAHCAFVPPTV